MSYNFPSKKKPPAANVESPKLDLHGLDMAPIVLSPEREQAAIETGEKLGYVAREPIPTAAPVVAPEASYSRRRKKQPNKAILVTGPLAVIDRFIEYTNDSGATSYWQALEKLLASVEKR